MNNSAKQQFSSNQLNSLLGMAGKKLGTDPETLRRNLEQGNITEIVKSMGTEDAAQVTRLLNNPQELEKLFNSPQVKELMSRLMGKG